MSRLAALFSINLKDCGVYLYCDRCGVVQKFKVFSQVDYSKRDKSKIPPAKPLYCKCDKCGFGTIYATDEFAELQERNEQESELCKIWDFGNLETGNSVWHEKYGVCKVESVIKSKDNASYTLSNGETTVTLNLPTACLLPPIYYRILPQDLAHAKIGENAYDTELKRTGTVVGFMFGEKAGIAVKFGEEISFINQEEDNFLSDAAIEKNAKWHCENLPFFNNLKIRVISKILLVRGSVANLKAARDLENALNYVPQIRCFVLLLDMQETDETKKIPDIYKLLVSNNIYISNCKIESVMQDIFVSGFYGDPSIPQRIDDVLAEFPVKSIKQELKFRDGIKVIKVMDEDGIFVRIVKSGKDVFIDGWVKNKRQKNFATFLARFCSLTFNVKNNLYIIA